MSQNATVTDKPAGYQQLVTTFLQSQMAMLPVPWFADSAQTSRSGVWSDWSQDAAYNTSWGGSTGQPPAYFYTQQNVTNILSLMPEAAKLAAAFNGSTIGATDEDVPTFNPTLAAQILLPLQYQLGSLLSKASEIGWTTHGHTGVDVNLYVYGAGTLYLAQDPTPPSEFGPS